MTDPARSIPAPTLAERTSVIEAKDLRMAYPPARRGDPVRPAVDGVSFQVRAGEIFGFLGPNGAGKTTTVSLLTTLLSPSPGSAFIEGVDVTSDPSEIRRRIGLVFQISTADGELTGRENLVFEAGLYGRSPATVRPYIDSLLARMELTHVADRLVKTYSGGMRRRLELAAGMVHEPKILFLDEPTLGLDPQGRAGFWKYIRYLRDTQGVTIFLTTHYLDEADQLCDRIAIIDHGKIIASGTPNELKDRMGGDTVEVVVAAGASDVTSVLAGLPGVLELHRSGDQYRFKCVRGESLVPKVVLACERVGVEIAGVATRKPSLDEVFLNLTGHSYREEGEVRSESNGSDSAPAELPAMGGA
ncbi:MAG: ATP-binding cassette domain-containing protein [Thermoplasmata archaeon]|nr:ATP-binding cassette domain-containing protein [Thermoplasmata archaeon]